MRHHPLILAIEDLWEFFISEIQNWLPLSKRVSPVPNNQQPLLSIAVPQSPLLLESSKDTLDATPTSESPLFEDDWDSLLKSDFYPAEEEFVDDPVSFEDDELVTIPQYFESYDPAVMYVLVKEAVCVARPERDFDTVLARFPYGTAVTVIGYQGNYAKVFWSHHEGWIKKDDLTPHKSEVWPHFTAGKIYEADNDAVEKLRLLIDDTFCAGDIGLPLQSGEWVTYRLREQNRLIPWPVMHGRLPGDWQILLKGVPGVHIGVIPKAETIMEWRGEDGIGRVAYVEKVSHEQILTITIAGLEEPGKFEEKSLSEPVWKELRPVFIEVL